MLDHAVAALYALDLHLMHVYALYTCQENCFQQYSCKDGIYVAWIWSFQKRPLQLICFINPLYDYPQMNQEISNETQHYHCDDEGLKCRVKAKIMYIRILEQSITHKK